MPLGAKAHAGNLESECECGGGGRGRGKRELMEEASLVAKKDENSGQKPRSHRHQRETPQ